MIRTLINNLSFLSLKISRKAAKGIVSFPRVEYSTMSEYSTMNEFRNKIEKELLNTRKAINIRRILARELSDIDKQLAIEDYFEYEHENKIIKEISDYKTVSAECLNLLIASFKSCEEAIIEFRESKKLLQGKKYADFIKLTNADVIFSVVVSNVIPTALKSDEIVDHNFTSLCERVGNKLINAYFVQEYERYKEWNDKIREKRMKVKRALEMEGIRLSEIEIPHVGDDDENRGGVCGEKTPMDDIVDINELSASPLQFVSADGGVIGEGITSFAEFKEHLPLINVKLETIDRIKYGLDLIELISQNSGLFGVRTEFNPEDKTTVRHLYIDDIAKNNILELFSDDVNTFPMICRPVDWKIKIINDDGDYYITNYGGYLRNEVMQTSFIHKNYKNVGVNKFKDDTIIKAINELQSVAFKVNVDVLNVITDYLSEGMLTDLIPISFHPLTNKLKEFALKRELGTVEEILRYNSRVFQNLNVLTNALILKDVESIYFPMFIDWRGRFYCRTASFSYQGGDLSKSLLLFKTGVILSNKGLEKLKIYLAKSYGMSNKKTLKALIEWVDENQDRIIDIDSKFWLEAKDPLQALACSIELKKFLTCDNPNNFYSYLPIYIDATCSGIQHLTALASDVHLAKNVNLLKSSMEDVPQDLYSDMAELVRKKIREYVNEKSDYAILEKLIIDRTFIKRNIMTIPYGVTIHGMAEQLISEHFIRLNEKSKDGKVQYKVKDNFVKPEVKDVLKFTVKDIRILASIIHSALFETHPDIAKVVKYFTSVVDFFSKLSTYEKKGVEKDVIKKLWSNGLIWIAPSGVIIEQKYVKFTQKKFFSNILGKKKTITLNTAVMDLIDPVRQRLGVIPNIIHSLDASNIALVINNYIRHVNRGARWNILTIHDCFATNANNIDLLTYYIKLAFISIYADNGYLHKFHQNMISILKNSGFLMTEDEKSICLDNTILIEIPPLPKLKRSFDVHELLESKYFIH